MTRCTASLHLTHQLTYRLRQALLLYHIPVEDSQANNFHHLSSKGGVPHLRTVLLLCNQGRERTTHAEEEEDQLVAREYFNGSLKAEEKGVDRKEDKGHRRDPNS